ncbi:MAG: secretin N-terminal domain-containing protein, partial [Pseudomonadota bacterium]
MSKLSFTRMSATLGIILFMGGCGSTDKSHVEQSLADELESIYQPTLQAEELAETPESVSETLMEEKSHAPTNLIEEERYDISARDVSARSFFSGLVKDTPYSVAIHPDVDGDISLELKQVTLDDIFELVTDMFGYHVEKHSTIYRVLPAGLHTEIFSVNYLMMQRAGQTQTSIISGGVSQSSDGGGGGQNNFNNNQNSFSNNNNSNNRGGLS